MLPVTEADVARTVIGMRLATRAVLDPRGGDLSGERSCVPPQLYAVLTAF